MQTCSVCNVQSPDLALNCVNCGADLKEFSKTAVARKKFESNPRVRLIYLIVNDDACPACQAVRGAYDKESVPVLPVEGCSHTNGCRCFYQPYLDEIYP